MSHLRPEDIASVHKKSACKKGRHRYGETQSIGGGIVRQICGKCGAVSIDLTGATDDRASSRQANASTGVEREKPSGGL
jgi:hypothetical protein